MCLCLFLACRAPDQRITVADLIDSVKDLGYIGPKYVLHLSLDDKFLFYKYILIFKYVVSTCSIHALMQGVRGKSIL